MFGRPPAIPLPTHGVPGRSWRCQGGFDAGRQAEKLRRSVGAAHPPLDVPRPAGLYFLPVGALSSPGYFWYSDTNLPFCFSNVSHTERPRSPDRPEFPKCFRTLVVKIEKINSNSHTRFFEKDQFHQSLPICLVNLTLVVKIKNAGIQSSSSSPTTAWPQLVKMMRRRMGRRRSRMSW